MKTWLLFLALAFGAGSDHESDIKSRSAGSTAGGTGRSTKEGCLTGKSLADFANGDAYNFNGMLRFLTDEKCGANAKAIRQDALAQGISFNEEPFRLRTIAKSYNPTSLEQSERLNQTLAKNVPEVLRQRGMSTSELLPLVGQLAVLSKSAAKSTLALAVMQELVAGDQLLAGSGKGKGELAEQLAGQIIKLGATNDAIVSELAAGVEEMAVSAQADSLGKVLRSLSEVSAVENSLVPTFDRSLSAGRAGVERGEGVLAKKEKGALLQAFLSAVTPERINPAAAGTAADEFNRVFQALLFDKQLAKGELKKFWKQVIRLLAMSRTQPALAEAVALSLTESALYLTGEDQSNLIAASENYASLATSLQGKFIEAWQSLHREKKDREISSAGSIERRSAVFQPLVAAIIGFEPEALKTSWLSFVIEKKLITDEQIEGRFPKLVLSQLKRREAALRGLGDEPTLNGILNHAAETWRRNLELSEIYIATLEDWVRRQPK